MAFPRQTIALLVLASFAAAVQLPAPSGPYNVGFTQQVISHTTPNDPTPGPGTLFLTSIYYPTLASPSPSTSVPYFDPTSASIWGPVFNILPSDLLSLSTTLQWQAPILPEKEAAKVREWPTLVFGPGGGMNVFMSTSLLSELASRGFTVLALDHPGEAPYLRLPGSETGVQGWDIRMPYTDALIQRIYDFRVGDMRALLSPSLSPNTPSFLSLVEEWGSGGAYFNTKTYGAFGHSIGAAQATGSMSALPSIIAGLNIDGGLFGNSSSASLHGRPYFMLMNPTHFDSDTTWLPFTARYAKEAEESGKGWLDWVTVEGASHLAFSDISLWVELLPQIPNSTSQIDLGSVEGRRVDELLRTYVGSFWDWVAGGEYNGILERETVEWPEVVFNRTVRGSA